MDEQLFNLFTAMAAGMEHDQREQIIEILRNPPTGRTPADLVQLLDLKKIVDELSRLTDGYEKRNWRDIVGDGAEQVSEFQGQYMRLHRQVVEYFGRVQYGSFSMPDLKRYAFIQDRIVFEDRLTAGRMEIQRMLDFYHEIVAQIDRIKQLPGFNLQKAQEYGSGLVRRRTNKSDEVTEHDMQVALNEGSYSDPAYLHGVWFLAKLFTQQEPKSIEAKTKEADEFERSFEKTTPKERDTLTAFKKGKDPKYSAQNYQIAYSEWCLLRFKQLFKE